MAVALAALGVVAVVAYLAQLAVTRADRVGSATAATYEARLALERARGDSLQAQAEQEKRRADALDDLLATLDRGGDPATARERVLRLWAEQRANHAAAAGARAVPPAPAAAAPSGDRDGLLRPGE